MRYERKLPRGPSEWSMVGGVYSGRYLRHWYGVDCLVLFFSGGVLGKWGLGRIFTKSFSINPHTEGDAQMDTRTAERRQRILNACFCSSLLHF